jgi:micrococcal nuclease
MKTLIFPLIFVACSAVAQDCQYTYRARIVAVYDGDTVTAEIDLGFNTVRAREILRLYGIDAPEVRGPERARGIVSRDALRGWIEGKEVTIRTVRDQREKYGRYLATIVLEGENINEKLITEKLAVRRDY